MTTSKKEIPELTSSTEILWSMWEKMTHKFCRLNHLKTRALAIGVTPKEEMIHQMTVLEVEARALAEVLTHLLGGEDVTA